MNLGELKEAVIDRLGIVPGATVSTSYDQSASATTLKNLINRALQRVSLEGMPTGWDWLSLEDTVSISSETNVIGPEIGEPLRFGPLWAQTGTLWVELERVGWAKLREAFPDTGIEGFPEVYAIQGRTILYGPAPDATYAGRWRCIIAEPLLSADADLPLMPVAYHDVIVEAACQLWFRRVANMPMATACAAEVQRAVTLMRQAQRPYSGTGRVTDRAFHYG